MPVSAADSERRRCTTIRLASENRSDCMGAMLSARKAAGAGTILGRVIIPTDTVLAALAREVGARLRESGRRLVTAESCTGGWIAKLCTDIPGSSTWFDCGFVCYSNAAKTRDLEVPAKLIETEGAVSDAVVRAMAEGALERTGANVAIAVSGIAGPGGP